MERIRGVGGDLRRGVCGIGTWAVRLGGGLRRRCGEGVCARALTAEVAVWMGLRLPSPILNRPQVGQGLAEAATSSRWSLRAVGVSR